MAVSQPRYSKEEFARRGDEIYERDIRPHVEAGNEGNRTANFTWNLEGDHGSLTTPLQQRGVRTARR